MIRLLGSLFLAAIAVGLSGCIIVDDGYDPEPVYNSAPYITDLYVDCYYGDYGYAWEFYAFVDDYDGYGDVQDVFVEAYYSGAYEETIDLWYDGNGEWFNSGWEDYDYAALTCYDYYYYEFDFYAYDSYQDEDSVTYIPTY